MIRYTYANKEHWGYCKYWHSFKRFLKYNNLYVMAKYTNNQSQRVAILAKCA